MELFFWIGLAFFLGWKVNEAFMLMTFRRILGDLKISDHRIRELAEQQGVDLSKLDGDAEQDENANLPVLEVRVEQQPEGLFAYRKDNDLFIAMGQDHTQLMENLIDNLNNVRVIIAKEDGADLIYPKKPA